MPKKTTLQARNGDSFVYNESIQGANKRIKIESSTMRPRNKLRRLINFDPCNVEERKKFNGASVLEEVQRTPFSARKQYTIYAKRFPRKSAKLVDDTVEQIGTCYPFHMAVALGASTDVVYAIYLAFPKAIKERCFFESEFYTPLQMACRFSASICVVSLLIEIWERNIEKKRPKNDKIYHHTAFENTTLLDNTSIPCQYHSYSLQCPCWNKLSLKLLEVLLGDFPEDVQLKNGEEGKIPHNERGIETPLEILTLLLDNYPFSTIERNHIGDTPLHTACRVGASPKFMSLVLEKCTFALREENNIGDLPLHQACRSKAPHEIVRLLLKAWPKTANVKNIYGETPLHIACWNQVPLEVLSLLLEYCPEAAKEKDRQGHTPFHTACLSKATAVMSLILEIYPDAVREKDTKQKTSLHLACEIHAPLDVMTLLLKKWPEAVTEIDTIYAKTPLDLVNSEEDTSSCNRKLLVGVSHILRENLGIDIAKDVLHDFAEIGWWDGVAMMFDRQTAVTRSLGIHNGIIPHLLAFVGSRCALLTMWEIIRNRQDLLVTVC